MLNNQKLYDRTMIVKMDKDNSREPRSGGDLPSGLAGIGPALNTRNRESMLGLQSPLSSILSKSLVTGAAHIP